MTLPGGKEALELVRAHVTRGAQLLEVDDGGAPLGRDLAAAGYHVTSTRPAASLAAPGTADAVLCLQPTRFGPLIPTLQQIAAALAPGGILVASDLVWQTAPTPELMRAFAPPPGREKVRPIEGWEMQAEHAGFEVVERREATRAEWLAHLAKDPAQQTALLADERGAAKLALWALRKA